MSDRSPDSASSPKVTSGGPQFGLLPLGLLVLIWVVALAHYPRLPGFLPTGFLVGGTPSGWGPKGIGFFVLPAMATGAFLLLGIIGRSAIRQPTLGGRAFHGRAALHVGRMISRFLFFMKSALLAFLLNIEFRGIQVAYGARPALGWDSYLVGGILVGYALAGSLILFLGARRWLRWQESQEQEG